MSKKRLGIGFIGAGFVAQLHIRSWLGVRDADILGVVSKSVARAEKTAVAVKKLNVGEPKVFTSITEMIADPGIDVIWICAPNFTRLTVMEEIVDALKSGKGEWNPKND